MKDIITAEDMIKRLGLEKKRNIMNIDYSKITNNSEVVKLLKQRLKLEAKIKALDPMALINHEIELLSLPDVVEQSEQYCDCDKPAPGDNVWSCGCGNPFKKKDK